MRASLRHMVVFIVASSLYGSTVFANETATTSGTKWEPSALMQLAKGQAYVPPQKKEKDCG